MRDLLLYAAALIAAELLHRRDQDLGTDEEADRFSAAAPVAVAAAIMLAPWQALLVTALSIGAVRRFQGDGWRESAVRAASLGGAALAGGYAYLLAGSETGSLALPEDLLGLTVLGVGFVAVKTLVTRLASGSAPTEPDVLPAGAEIALGGVAALAVDANLWHAALLVPTLILIEQLYGRAIGLRREVAAALETFANLVDERHPSTFRHSVRVAESVRELAEALGLPRSEVQRLWWAGRLHDLGKVAVDAAALRKTGLLNTHDWEAMRRAPRLSARLLQRFRFAAQQAKAVEYHRERYDGGGYYGARGADVPLAAHMLIVADAFDAMTTDRPFRSRLTEDEALVELEQNAGRQFHPTIVRAFAAIRRGLPIETALSADELASLRSAPVAAPPRPELRTLRTRPDLLVLLGAAVALVGLGISLVELSAVGGVVAAVGAVVWSISRRRARRLGRRLDDALVAPGGRSRLFFALAEAFETAWSQEYSLLVAWDEDANDGRVELSRGANGVPVAEVMSWLLRGSESDREVIVDDGDELGRDGYSVALPLRRENSALVGFLVFGGGDHPPTHVLAAARSRLDAIGLGLADAPFAEPERTLEAVTG